MLSGNELLERIKQLGGRPRAELVRDCGYVTTRGDGQERLNFTAFYEALLEAKGMQIGRAAGQGTGRRGRKPSYFTKVQFNGNLMVGAAYIAQLGVKPGDQFEIRLSKQQIKLMLAGHEAEA